MTETAPSDPDDCFAFTDVVSREADDLRLIVGNAGVRHSTPALEITLARWSEALALMPTAPFTITRGLLPLLLGERTERIEHPLPDSGKYW